MITGMNVPLELAVGLCALFCVVGAWAGQARALRRQTKQRHPLADLMQSANLDQVIDLATRRNAISEASHAVLHGQIDWGGSTATREQLQGSIAAVMRAGLRRGDHVTHIEGDGFTIILPGADERAGARIADRLRSALAQAGETAGGAARFGVAAGLYDKGGDLLNRRARRALDAALAQGYDHIVTASEIEEVVYLPAPERQHAASAA